MATSIITPPDPPQPTITATTSSATVSAPAREGVDFILLILLLGIMFSIGMLVVVKFVWPNDQVMFTVVSGILGNFSGSFFTRIQSRGSVVQVNTKDGKQ